jgi:hypothetical protein
METVTRQIVENNLEREWPEWLRRVTSLSPDDKTAFLRKQGYPSLSSVIAHVVVWWREGDQNIQRVMRDPTFKSPQVNVDAINAAVIEKNKDRPEQELQEEFQQMRMQLVKRVSELTEAQWNHEEIQKELYWDIVNHYAEHRFETV